MKRLEFLQRVSDATSRSGGQCASRELYRRGLVAKRDGANTPFSLDDMALIFFVALVARGRALTIPEAADLAERRPDLVALVRQALQDGTKVKLEFKLSVEGDCTLGMEFTEPGVRKLLKGVAA